MPNFLWISSRAACAVHSAKGNCIWSGHLFAIQHAPRFHLRQYKLITNTPPALSFLDAGRAVAPECPIPTADRPAMYSDSQCCFHVCRAVLDKKHSTLAKSFLRREHGEHLREQ